MTNSKRKRYRVSMACPQCGCSAVANLSKEEIQERYGDVPNVEMDCHECLMTYETAMKDACPDWDHECRMMQEGKKGE